MKSLKIILFALLVSALFACKKSDDNSMAFPGELAKVTNALKLSFDSLNVDMSLVASTIAQNPNDTNAIRSYMLNLCDASSFVLEFSYVTPQGIMQIVEPAVYHNIQGSNISQQAHVITAFQTKMPVLSNTFNAVEGFKGAVDIHPVVKNTQVLGGITGLFLTRTILERIIAPIVANQEFEIWVMEKGGITLYDQDTAEIGLNVITDPLYQAFPELIAAAQLMNTQKSGETSYSFYKTGTSTKVTKRTFWSTFELYGQEWKIIWVKPE